MICNYYSRFDQLNAGKPIRFAQSRSGKEGAIEVRLPDDVLDSLTGDDRTAVSDGWYNTGKSVLVLPDRTVEVRSHHATREVFPGRSNSEAVRSILERKCHYISLLSLIGSDNGLQSAILYPHFSNLRHPDYRSTPLDGCFCPRDLQELGKCLGGCLHEANAEIGTRFPKVQTFIVAEEDIH